MPFTFRQFGIQAGHERRAVRHSPFTQGLHSLGDLRADGLAVFVGHRLIVIGQPQRMGALPFFFGMRLPAPLTQPAFNEVPRHVGDGPVFLVRSRFQLCQKGRRKGSG